MHNVEKAREPNPFSIIIIVQPMGESLYIMCSANKVNFALDQAQQMASGLLISATNKLQIIGNSKYFWFYSKDLQVSKKCKKSFCITNCIIFVKLFYR